MVVLPTNMTVKKRVMLELHEKVYSLVLKFPRRKCQKNQYFLKQRLKSIA